MTTLLIRCGLYIAGMIAVEIMADSGLKVKWYKIPFYTLGYITFHIVIWSAMIGCVRYIVDACKGQDIGNVGVINILISLAMLIIYAPCCYSDCVDNVSPLWEFWHNYKNVCSNGPRISFSIFKKMFMLHPEKFDLNGICFLYGKKRFSLSLPGYIWVTYMKWRNEQTAVNNEYNAAQRKVYDVMQRDLQNDLDKVVREREAALDSINKAAHDTQDILARISNERR